jgi:TRAP-type C4-dicarboxylate transport system permease small subunit
VTTAGDTRPLLQPVGEAPALLRTLGRTVDWAVIVIGALMTAGVFVNVVLHQFGRDLAWVTELGELLMVWVTFLGGVCAAQRGLHMSINEFVDKLAPAARHRADAVIAALGAAVMALLTVYGWRLVQANWDNQLTVLEWPMALQYMGMAVGCTLMTLFMACDAWQAARGVPRERRYPSADRL